MYEFLQKNKQPQPRFIKPEHKQNLIEVKEIGRYTHPKQFIVLAVNHSSEIN